MFLELGNHIQLRTNGLFRQIIRGFGLGRRYGRGGLEQRDPHLDRRIFRPQTDRATEFGLLRLWIFLGVFVDVVDRRLAGAGVGPVLISARKGE